MRAADQRPILAVMAVTMLGLLAGCTAGARRGVDPLRLADPSSTAAHSRGTQPGFPADPSLAIEPGAPETVSEFDASHPAVQDFVEEYQTSLRGYIQRALQRGSKYLPRMTSILAEEGVPPELAYLPIVESGFSLHAVSHAGAVGPWQFVRGTGRRYGLRIDGYVDERRDPEKATRAAARYLRDLYDRFGDWHLALAGYNSGEGNVERIQNWRGVENYWEMSERRLLPRETREFVPRFLAAVEIAKSPEDYGFEMPPAGAPTRFDTVHVSRPISLRAVAELSGTTVENIKELNPALNRGMVPPKGYPVRLPRGTRERFEIAYATYRAPAPAPAVAVAGRTHKVRRGETVGSIAKRYGVSANAIMKVNGIRNAKSLKAGRVLQIPPKPTRTRFVASRPQRSTRYN